MPRPRKCRKVCRMPIADTFVANSAKEEAVVLTVDEYECIRLVDYQGFSQEQCAEYMQVSVRLHSSFVILQERSLLQLL